MLTGLILAAAALFVPQDKVQVSSAEIRPVAGSESAFQVVVDLEVVDAVRFKANYAMEVAEKV